MAVICEMKQQEPAPLAPVSDSEMVSDNGAVRVTFSSTTDGNAVEFRAGDYYVRYTPREIKYVDRASGLEDVLCDADSSVAAYAVREYQVYYDRHFEGVTESWKVEAGQLKHNVTLNLDQRPPAEWIENAWLAVAGSFEFHPDLHVEANGLEFVGEFDTEGSISLIDPNGRTVFVLPPVIAWDQKVEEIGGMYLAVSIQPGRIDLATAIDNDWLSDVARAYPVVIDPTVVATNGVQDYLGLGTEIVRRVHGTNTVYSLALDRVQGSVYGYNLYRSTDNGANWSLAAAVTDPDAGASSMSKGCLMVTSTGEVYIFAVTSSNNQTVYYYPGSGSTVTYKRFTSGQPTGVGGCTDPNGNIWFVCGTGASIVAYFIPKGNVSGTVQLTVSTSNSAVYATRDAFFDPASNAIYCSFNVASSSVGVMKITPNSIASPTAITYTNVVTIGATSSASSTITRLQNGNVLLAYTNGVVTQITANEYILAGTLVSSKTVTALPAAILTGTGVSGDAYLGATSDGPNWYLFAICGAASPYSLVFSKNGGAWTTLQTPAQYASVSQLSEYSVTTKTNLDYVFLANATTPRTLSFDSVALNTPPLAPTPTQHANFDATIPQTLAWTFNDTVGDTQSAYQLLIVDVATSNTAIDTGKVPSTAGSYALAANALQNGKQYQWKVNTWDAAGAQGTYSNFSTFYTAAPPTVTITSPATDGATLAVGTVTPQWSYSDPAGNAQQTFRVQLTDSNDAVLWDSGQKTDATANAYTVMYPLTNNKTYKIKVTVSNSKGITGTTAVRTFVTSFTPPPVPTLAATKSNGYVGLVIANPAPSGTQPALLGNDIYRRKAGDTSWTRIATSIGSNGTYNDYHVRSATAYEYKVTAIGSNSTGSDSAISSATITLDGIWLHDTTSPATTARHFALFDHGRSGSFKANVSLEQFAGRALPVPFFGLDSVQSVQLKVNILNAADMDALKALVASRKTLCYRDARGRKMFGVIRTLNDTDEFYGSSAPITFEAVDFTEVV